MTAWDALERSGVALVEHFQTLLRLADEYESALTAEERGLRDAIGTVEDYRQAIDDEMDELLCNGEPGAARARRERIECAMSAFATAVVRKL